MSSDKNSDNRTLRVTHAKCVVDEYIKRDEKICNLFDENIRREYKFTYDPSLVSKSDTPMVLIVPKFNTYVDLIEYTSNFMKDVCDTISTNPTNDIKRTVVELVDIINHIVNTKSWHTGKLNQTDRKDIEEMITNLRIPNQF